MLMRVYVLCALLLVPSAVLGTRCLIPGEDEQYFTCPRPGDSKDWTYCCKPTYRKQCCTLEERDESFKPDPGDNDCLYCDDDYKDGDDVAPPKDLPALFLGITIPAVLIVVLGVTGVGVYLCKRKYRVLSGGDGMVKSSQELKAVGGS